MAVQNELIEVVESSLNTRKDDAASPFRKVYRARKFGEKLKSIAERVRTLQDQSPNRRTLLFSQSSRTMGKLSISKLSNSNISTLLSMSPFQTQENLRVNNDSNHKPQTEESKQKEKPKMKMNNQPSPTGDDLNNAFSNGLLNPLQEYSYVNSIPPLPSDVVSDPIEGLNARLNSIELNTGYFPSYMQQISSALVEIRSDIASMKQKMVDH